MDDGHNIPNEPGTPPSEMHPTSRGWRWLWLLVPIAVLIGLFLWIYV
jgi:hypothetical protein